MERCEYIIGTEPIPTWCKDYLSPYQKMDGSVGWEFYSKFRDYDLIAGDKLILDGYLIKVERRGRG